uniref:Uncharacterized protein n=1 Tax=Onchocerca volvulus TaxID=6282 RepID=A0A8R1XNP3_ONCVO
EFTNGSIDGRCCSRKNNEICDFGITHNEAQHRTRKVDIIHHLVGCTIALTEKIDRSSSLCHQCSHQKLLGNEPSPIALSAAIARPDMLDLKKRSEKFDLNC